MAGAKKSGYSGTRLERKLGIKDNFRIRLIHAPDNYFVFFTEWPENIEISDDPGSKEIEQNGMIWVSWLKKTTKRTTELSEDIIRNYALEHGLVDVKVCSVSEEWSALKLVIPLKLRKKGDQNQVKFSNISYKIEKIKYPYLGE